MKPSNTNEVSASVIVEAITRQMAREFKSSKPKPRNRVMGFRGTDKRPDGYFGESANKKKL